MVIKYILFRIIFCRYNLEYVNNFIVDEIYGQNLDFNDGIKLKVNLRVVLFVGYFFYVYLMRFFVLIVDFCVGLDKGLLVGVYG